MKILVSKKAAIISLILALPLTTFATYLWIEGVKGGIYSEAAEEMGMFVFYVLGFPLGTFVFKIFLSIGGEKFHETTEIWAIPFLNIAFLLQWLIWFQVFAFLWHKSEAINEKTSNLFQPL